MKKTYFIIITLLALATVACDENPQPCVETQPEAAIINEFPDSLKAGNTYSVDIRYVLENSCGSFDRFDIVATEKSFDIKLITKYEGCNCNLEFEEANVDFDIDLDFPGVYEFNFWQAQGDYDTRSVTIY